MNILEIFNMLEERDPEVYERLDTRRSVMSAFANVGKKLTLATIPVALGAMFQKAYGKNSAAVDVLNFALTLEFLEYRFYDTAVNKAGLIPAGVDTTSITTIRNHEMQHVAFLKTAITGAGGTPIAEPKFDFSGAKGAGNGPFATAFSDYKLFLAVAQTLEDTGVRAYKGQAPNLLQTGDVLTAALKIHSVEARHASHLRKMRSDNGFATVKPWITGVDSGGIGALVAANYAGEDNTTQAGVSIVNIGGQTISTNAATEAFDEPLTQAAVLAIASAFIAA